MYIYYRYVSCYYVCLHAVSVAPPGTTQQYQWVHPTVWAGTTDPLHMHPPSLSTAMGPADSRDMADGPDSVFVCPGVSRTLISRWPTTGGASSNPPC
jgi:hypothetical protein